MSLQDLTDDQLLGRLDALKAEEDTRLAEFIAHLGEVDRRDLARKRGYQSTFDFCTKHLRLSADEAWRRLRAARAGRLHPEVFSRLADGSANLTTIALIGPHLTPENSARVLGEAGGRTTRDVRKLAASLDPQPDKPDSIRRASSGEPKVHPLRPLSADRLHVSFTASADFQSLLERAKDLLWHKFPFGRIEDVLTEALREYVTRHDPGLKLNPALQRPARERQTRRVPRWVRDRVWRRDGGRCAFMGPDGWRCEATRGLEFDHIKPWALGGSSDDPANIRLLCRGHNQLRAKEEFG